MHRHSWTTSYERLATEQWCCHRRTGENGLSAGRRGMEAAKDFARLRKSPPGPTAVSGRRLWCESEVELLDSISNLIAVQSEQRRRARLVAPRPPQRLDDEVAFQLFEVDASGRQLEAVAGRGSA